MIKAVRVSLLALLLLSPRLSDAHFHGSGFPHHPFPHAHVFVGFGPAWWGPGFFSGPYPWGYPYAYPYGWYYPPPYYAYPAFSGQQPQVYIQQEPAVATSEPSRQAYWYYCPSVEAYYPTVKRCPEAWIKVPPTPQ